MLLLDTHCWLWLKAEPDRLPSPLRRRLSRDSTKLVLSVACVLEISIKHVARRLNPDHNPAMLIAELLEEGVLPLDVTVEHALRLASLAINVSPDPISRDASS